MEMFNAVLLSVVGLYLILLGLTIECGNFRSVLVFKFTPLLLGLCSIFSALKLFGLI